MAFGSGWTALGCIDPIYIGYIYINTHFTGVPGILVHLAAGISRNIDFPWRYSPLRVEPASRLLDSRLLIYIIYHYLYTQTDLKNKALDLPILSVATSEYQLKENTHIYNDLPKKILHK